MSWMPYIEKLTAIGEHKIVEVTDAAICGIEVGSVWASTPKFAGITSDEIKAAAAKPKNGTLTLAGVKALVLGNDEKDGFEIINLVTMKNKEMDQSSPLVIGYTGKAMVIGLGTSEARTVGVRVYAMTKYLKGQGY